MSLSFFDVEFDLDLGPEAFHTLGLVPRTDFELDAPGYSLPGAEPVHDLRQCPARGRRSFPLFYTPIVVGDRAETFGRCVQRILLE